MNLKNKYVELTREIVLSFIDKEDVTLFLFGSRVGNSFRHSSDIDVGFISNKKIEQKLFSKIREALEESIIPYYIDLVDFETVDKAFKKIALREIEIWNKARDLSIN